jgi:GNAT superfamily N-acetyltransferase
MHLRKATAKDSAALAQIQVDSYRTAYAGILPESYLARFSYEEQTQDWQDLLATDTGDLLLVAETEAGEVVGYALGRRADPCRRGVPPYDGELVALHVQRRHQGQGIGQRLIVAMAQALSDMGCQSMLLWVLEGNPARTLYERLGGQLIAEKSWGGNEAYGLAVKEVAYGWPTIGQLCKLAD